MCQISSDLPTVPFPHGFVLPVAAVAISQAHSTALQPQRPRQFLVWRGFIQKKSKILEESSLGADSLNNLSESHPRLAWSRGEIRNPPSLILMNADFHAFIPCPWHCSALPHCSWRCRRRDHRECLPMEAPQPQEPVTGDT